jgi:hypothetical protein
LRDLRPPIKSGRTGAAIVSMRSSLPTPNLGPRACAKSEGDASVIMR